MNNKCECFGHKQEISYMSKLQIMLKQNHMLYKHDKQKMELKDVKVQYIGLL